MSFTSMSVSDLVPFVAAVLKDQAVTDENKELRQQLNDQINERLLVQVTGRDGTPVYYRGSLKDGGTFINDRNGSIRWVVYFRKKKDDSNNNVDEDIIVVPLNLICELEIRLGGHIVFFMRNTTTATNWPNYEEEFEINSNKPQMGGVHFSNHSLVVGDGLVECVYGRIGPIPWNDYRDRKLNDMDAPTLRNVANYDSNQTQDLIVTAIEFNKDLLGESIISLLEKMGTSTTNVHNKSWIRSVRRIGRPPAPIIGKDDADVADAAAAADADAGADADADTDT